MRDSGHCEGLSTRFFTVGVWIALVACNSSAPSDDPDSGLAGSNGAHAGAGGATPTGGTSSAGTTAGSALSGAAGSRSGSAGLGGSAGVGGIPASGGTALGGIGGGAGSFTPGGAGSAQGGSAQGGSAQAGVSGNNSSGSAGSAGTSQAGSSAAGGSAGTGGGSGEPVFHAFLLLGQSNMAGYPKAQAADKVENPRIRVLGFDDCTDTGRKTDEWDTASAPLHECWNGAIGPGDYFAKTLIDKVASSDTIGLVPCAISGEKIETFMKNGGSKYTYILERARLAQEAGGVIEGILFHQGESNCGDGAWPGKVATLIEDLRADLTLGDVPFLAGELAYSGNCNEHNPLVNELPDELSNTWVVSANGLAVDPADTQWNLHFDHDAQVEFGKRYAAKLVEALNW